MDKDSRPKRYFWRRLAAFVADFLLAYVVAVVVLMAADAVTGGQFYYWDGVLRRTACMPAPPSPVLDELNTVFPAVPDWQRTQIICQTLPVGGKARYMLTVKDERQEGNTNRFQYVSVAVTPSGDQLDTTLKLDPTVFAAYLLMLVWARYFGLSPGKRWFRLAVLGREGVSEASPRLLRREWLRLGPLLLLSLVGVVFALIEWWLVGSISDFIRLTKLFVDAPIAWAAPYAVLCVVLVVYYLVPFLRWRGQTLYDRLAGTMVVLAKGDGEAVS